MAFFCKRHKLNYGKLSEEDRGRKIEIWSAELWNYLIGVGENKDILL